MAVLRIDRAARPCERSNTENRDTDGIDPPRPAEFPGADQHCKSGKSENEPNDDARSRTISVWPKPVDQHHPQRDRSNQQSRDSRRYPLFGKTDSTIPYSKE